MSTKIELNYDGKDYTLEYSRNAVRQMEEQGFVLDQLTEKPVSMIPRLVYGAFIKNHKGIKRNLVDEIYENIANKTSDNGDGFIQSLFEMYAETVSTLTENSAADEGNMVVWKVTKG